jgi:hypothetical protein
MAESHFSGPIVYGDVGTVTQTTSATTAVTLNAAAGRITTVTQNIAAAAEVAFVVNNDRVKVGMVPTVAIASGSVGGTPLAFVSAVSAGAFTITISNLHASAAETGVLVINFKL